MAATGLNSPVLHARGSSVCRGQEQLGAPHGRSRRWGRGMGRASMLLKRRHAQFALTESCRRQCRRLNPPAIQANTGPSGGPHRLIHPRFGDDPCSSAWKTPHEVDEPVTAYRSLPKRRPPEPPAEQVIPQRHIFSSDASARLKAGWRSLRTRTRPLWPVRRPPADADARPRSAGGQTGGGVVRAVGADHSLDPAGHVG